MLAYISMLNLANLVSVVRTISTTDGMGGATSTSSTTILPLAAIWENGSSNRYMSDKVYKSSTHTLAFRHGDYTFGAADASGGNVVETISYDGQTYKLVGRANNVFEKDEVMVHGMELNV